MKQCIISREEFSDAISRLREAGDLVNKVEELFRYSQENVDCDFCNSASLQVSHEFLVISLLEKIMDDKNNDIKYFVYELDYGREYKPGYVSDEEGDVDFSTSDALYDYLVSHNINED